MISLPSSLAAGEFTDCTSHLSLRTSHQAIHHASALVSAVASAGRAAASAAAASARACLPLLAPLFALPSSLLGPYPCLYHTALLGPNHCLQTLLSVSCCWMPLRLLSCLLPDRFSLFSALFPLPFPLCHLLRSVDCAQVTSIFASGHRLRPILLRPFAAPSLARRNARSD